MKTWLQSLQIQKERNLLRKKGTMKTVRNNWNRAKVGILALAFSLCAYWPLASQADLYQNFDQWETAGFSSYETNGWQLEEGTVYNNHGLLNKNTNAYFRSKFSSNGIGRTVWECKLYGPGQVTYSIQTSSDNTNWTTHNVYTSDVDNVWQAYTNEVISYEGLYIRWKVLSANQYIQIDNVHIRLPPSYVNITNAQTHPATPIVGTNTFISTTVEPQAGASNITASLFYRTDAASSFTEISMSSNAPNSYITDTGILATTPNLTVEYYVKADFEGRYTSSMQYYPDDGSSDPTSFVLRALSPYTNISVRGTHETNLYLVDDNQWKGVLTTTGALSDPVFYFDSGSSTWGDDNQSVSNLPVYGTAQADNTNITVKGTVTSHLAFAFDDNVQDYSIQRCEYINFDNWTAGTTSSYGTYTNSDGWVLDGGRINKNSDNEWDRALRGRYAILKYGYTNQFDREIQYLRSPHMDEGVGNLSFWYRNWEKDGSPDAGYLVQKSATGTGDWITVSDSYTTNITSAGYLWTEIGIADRNAHYVRIVNTNESNNSWLCLDEVTITHPGATVDLVDPWRSVNSPLLGESIDVSISTTNVAGGATNLEGYVWFRHADSTVFSSIALTRSNNTFQGTIPPTPEGDVEYYFECTYEGFNSAQSFYPDAGPEDSDLLTYTNQPSLGSLREEDFQTWSGGALGDYTNSAGWTLHYGTIYQNRGLLGAAAENPSLTSPVLSNGVGSIYFDVANENSGEIEFEVQTSTNGSTFTTVATYTNSTVYSGRNDSSVEINDRNVTRVRILKISDGSALYLYIDNVVISLPPADVDITDQYYSPGYPMTNDEVAVSCVITSINTKFPAYNFDPELYYRGKNEAWTTVGMNHAGSNVYNAVIPAHRPGTVQYYIKCGFNGFYYGLENQSPAFLPDAAATNERPDTYLSYNVRYHDSEYSHLAITGTVEDTSMNLIGDDYWQGVIAIEQPTNEIQFSLNGYNKWLGSSYSSGIDTWGETNQIRYETPIQAEANPEGDNIIVRGDFTGTNQLVVRYDLTTRTYLIFGCSFQDFNQWNLASTKYFDESLTGNTISSTTNTFDHWPVDSVDPGMPDTMNEGIESWDLGTYFDNSGPSDLSANGWLCQAAEIIGDPYGGQDQALRLDPTETRIYTQGKIWPHRATLTKGLDTFQFKYYWSVTKDNNLAYYNLGSNLDNYEISATITGSETSPRPSYSVLARYQDTDNYYEFRLRSRDTDNTDTLLQVYRQKEGETQYIGTRADNNSNLRNRTQNIKFSVCTNNGGRTYMRIESNGEGQTFHDTDTTANLASPGSFGFLCNGADIRIDDVKVRHQHRQHFDNWVDDASGWVVNNGYVHSSDNACRLPGNSDATLTTPYLGYDAGRLYFSYDRYTGSTACELAVYGSSDGSTWTGITNWSVTGNGSRTLTDGLAGYDYFQIRNTNSTTAGLEIDNVVITQDEYFYNNSFDTAASTSDWTDVTGDIWYHDSINKTYNRPGFAGPPMDFVVQQGYTNNSTSYAPASWIDIATITATNIKYQTANIEFEYWDEIFVRVKHDSGEASLVLDDLKLTKWRGTDSYTDTNNWKATGIWVSEHSPGNRCIELWRSKINPDKPQYVRSPVMNGVGSVTFLQKVANGPAEFQVEIASESAPDTFVPQETVTVTNTDWQTYTYMLQTNDNFYVRIRHTTTNRDAVLYIDDMQLSDYAERDNKTWAAYNALITPNEDSREFEPYWGYRTAYLNNDPTDGVAAGNVFDSDMPYIQSPRMPNGIGEISFWYRNWETDGLPTATFHVMSASGDGGTFDEWTHVATVSGITNTDYRYYTTNHYNADHHYVRVYSETNSGYSRLAMDNLLIGDPLAADFSVTNLATIPDVPLYSSSVDLSVDLYNFVLNPENIKIRAYYNIGSNNWGQWDQWNTNNYIDLDYVASSSSIQRTYQSAGSSIPQMGVNTVVQYYVEFTFDGPHSDKTSPKTYAVFSNPDYYEPIDLNEGQSVTNPYYFVLGSEPGEVWLNEVNYANHGYETTNEYIEIAGREGINVNDWKIEMVTTADNTYDGTTITNGSPFSNISNGFGFIVYGDPGVNNVDLVFATPTDQDIEKNSGARLVRGMGAHADKICWGDPDTLDTLTSKGYRYIGEKYTIYAFSPLYATGTGIEKDDFTEWEFNTSSGSWYSPGEENESQTLIAYQSTQTLTVASALGTPSPATGTNAYPRGTTLNCRMTDSPINIGLLSTQYLCTGWSGSGDIPTSGSTTNTGEFMLLNDSSITWQWVTNVYLDVQTNGNGSVDNTGWYQQHSAVTVTATAAEYNAFTGWTGDTNGCNISSNILTIDPLSEPRGPITANFESTDRTLDVTTTYAATNIAPPAGSHVYHDNEPLSAVVSNRAVYQGTMATQYWVTGWSQTGSVPEMPVIGTETNFDWICQGMETWNNQDAEGWQAALIADGDEDGLGNFVRDTMATNGISTGDDRIIATFPVDYFSLYKMLYWDTPVTSPTGQRVYTIVFNSTDISTATHYIIPTNANTFFTVDGDDYDCGTALAGEWTPLVAPETNNTAISTGPFNITSDSSINWLWQTNHYMDISTSGSGSVDVASGWFQAASIVTITASAETGYTLDSWSGDTNGCVITDLQIEAPMTVPRNITANFIPTSGDTTDKGTPYLWLSEYYTSDYDYWDTNDSDFDGMVGWMEYVTGTDPTNKQSTFEILEIGYAEGSNFIKWYATTNSGVYEPFGIYRTTNILEGWGLPYVTNVGPRDPDGTGTNIWWDTNLPPADVPVYYRPYVIWTNGQ